MKNITWSAVRLTGVAFLASTAMSGAVEFSEELAKVKKLGSLTHPPAMREAQGKVQSASLKAIFYDGVDWKGSPTRVFAWLGIPDNQQGKVPGVVLIHGGGGTAFPEWVKLWNRHGFAAISIAVEGQTDAIDQADQKSWTRHDWAGPARVGIYGDSNEPLKDQWMYHAVADTVLANSLLGSFPEVDAGKVGVMGISWGGVIASTVIGIDPRFAFAIPVYGCGHLGDADNQYGQALGGNALYQGVWDPMVRMEQVKTPVLWSSWPQDSHFPLDCQAACYRASAGDHMVALIPGMGHSHEASWVRPESYAFAESIVRDGKPWCLQTSVTSANEIARAEFTATKPLDRAILVSTVDTGVTGGKKWVESPAKLEKSDGHWSCSAPLPVGTTGWFINVLSGDLTAGSDYQIRENP